MATWCPLTHILTSSVLAWHLQYTPTFAIWQVSKTLFRPRGQIIQQPTASHLPPAPAPTWKVFPHFVPRFSNICLGNDHLEIGPQPNRATAPAWRLRYTLARRNSAKPSTSLGQATSQVSQHHTGTCWQTLSISTLFIVRN